MIRIHPTTLRNLERVFTPPGLPLVSKFEGAEPTTTVLIRGPAGAGKSSLAFAVARDLALSGQGAVLYLTTEAFPAEVVHKAELFGVSQDQVFLWAAQDRATSGAVCVQHLAVEVSELEEDALTTQERSALALGAVQSLLTRWAGPVPVRAVVIDGFGLPEPTSTEAYALRTAALTCIQALEIRGVSSVLVEEIMPGLQSALPFVVDVVFELSFNERQPENTYRQLRAIKSRFSAADPDWRPIGWECGRPAVHP